MFVKQGCRAEGIKTCVSRRGGNSTLKRGQLGPPVRWHLHTSSHDVTVQRPKIQRPTAVKSQTFNKHEIYVSKNATLKFANY